MRYVRAALAWWCWLTLPAVVLAQADPTPAAVLVRLQSVDALLQNLKRAAALSQQQDAARQIEAVIKTKVGNEAFDSIHPTRPVAAYVRFGKDIEDVGGALLIPVKDEKGFLTLLRNLNLPVEEGKAGVYTVKKFPNVDVYFRFVDSYAAFTALNPDNLNKLPDFAKLLPAQGLPTFSVQVNLDQLPDGAKLLALAQIEQTLADAAGKQAPDDSEVQRQYRAALSKEAARAAGAVLKEGKEFRLDLDLKEDAREMKLDLKLTARPGTELHKQLQDAGARQSLFGKLFLEAPMVVSTQFTLSPALQRSIEAVFDESMQRSFQRIQDEQGRKKAEELWKAMLPTLRAGEVDGLLAAHGPEGKHYTLVGAFKLRSGAALGQMLEELIKEGLRDTPAVQQHVALGFETVNGVRLHKFDIPPEPRNAAFFDKVTGNSSLLVAFRDDAVFVAMGPQALAQLKAALASTQGNAGTAGRFEFDLARMLPLLAENPQQQQALTPLLQASPDHRIRIRLDAGEHLALGLQVRLATLELLARLAQPK